MVVIVSARQLMLFACGIFVMLACAVVRAQPAHYPSPDEAVNALLAAVDSQDEEALTTVLGPDIEELGSGDPVADEAARALFIEKAAEASRVQLDGDDRAELLVGSEEWPFSIPLVKEPGGWRFDIVAGKEELANRRVGSNELHTIATARAYVEAQYEYAARDPRGEGVRQYAQRFGSSEGKHDGLFWTTDEGEPESPLGPLVAQAVEEGYGAGMGHSSPYHGYYYRILKAQGSNAPGGARSYLKDGRMVDGFGLIAYPAEYGRSGIMTFIVNHRGLMFQKDLGEDTHSLAAAITEYDPDTSWTPVAEDLLAGE